MASPRFLFASALVAGSLVLIPAPSRAQPAEGDDPDGEVATPPADDPEAPAVEATAPIAAPVEVPAEAPAVDVEPAPAPVDDAPIASVGGYLQPQVRIRQNSDADNDEDGFRFRRARLTLKGRRSAGEFLVGVEAESELTPDFQLLDGFVWARGDLPADGTWRVDLGQVKAPFSRQTLLSDAALMFPEKAEIASLAPDRQIGARVSVELPGVPMVQLRGGIFNGEGKNQIRNIDENFLYVGRLEVTPMGRGTPLQEGGFADFLTIAVDAGTNKIELGVDSENTVLLGADIAGSWHGISASFEYLWSHHTFPQMGQPDYHAFGYVGQVGYLLPLSGFFAHKVEVAARFEEIDRNDAVPVDTPGDPNQSTRNISGALSFYQVGHNVKLQAAFTHYQEVETRSRNGSDITFANDQLLVQATYRLE